MHVGSLIYSVLHDCSTAPMCPFSRRMRSFTVRVLFHSAAVFILAALALSQNPRGSLRGAVQDRTGARIPGAKIVVESLTSTMRRQAETEDRGEVRLDDLAPGSYRIDVAAPGFDPAQANLSVEVSSVREVTVTLKPAAPPESVIVTSW